jgi:hypothetical protein
MEAHTFVPSLLLSVREDSEEVGALHAMHSCGFVSVNWYDGNGSWAPSDRLENMWWSDRTIRIVKKMSDYAQNIQNWNNPSLMFDIVEELSRWHDGKHIKNVIDLYFTKMQVVEERFALIYINAIKKHRLFDHIAKLYPLYPSCSLELCEAFENKLLPIVIHEIDSFSESDRKQSMYFISTVARINPTILLLHLGNLLSSITLQDHVLKLLLDLIKDPRVTFSTDHIEMLLLFANTATEKHCDQLVTILAILTRTCNEQELKGKIFLTLQRLTDQLERSYTLTSTTTYTPSEKTSGMLTPLNAIQSDSSAHLPTGTGPRSTGGPIQWRKGALLGSGAAGKVYCGLNLETGEMIAVKKMRIPSYHDKNVEQEIRQIRTEIQIMQSLNHSNIVHYLGFDQDQDKLYVFLEYMSGGTLSG